MTRDAILALIYTDLEHAMDQIRDGANPSAMLSAHGCRAAPLWDMIDDMDRQAWRAPVRILDQRAIADIQTRLTVC